MPEFIKQTFIKLVLPQLGFGRSLTEKFIFKDNQPCMVWTMLINLNPDEHHSYPFMVSVGRCDRNCVPNQIEVENLKVFNVINRINKSKTFENIHISYECRCKFNDGKECNWWQKWNNNVGVKN